MEHWESPVDRAIREAQERGEFYNLPGAGQPLTGLGNPDADDPDWWVKRLVRREQLDMTGAMPPAIALRKEADTFPESLLELRDEDSVRAVLEDFNRRVRLDRLRPAVGALPPLIARTVDVDDLLQQWRELTAHEKAARERAARDRALAARRDQAAGALDAARPDRRPGRRSWLGRLLNPRRPG